MEDTKNIYEDRKLSECYPDLYQLAHKQFYQNVSSRSDASPRIERIFTYLERLVDLNKHRNMMVLGCGPRPQEAMILASKGYKVVGVEPIKSFVETAQAYLGDSVQVIQGAAEAIPLPDGSQDVVVFESVLEHVDSIPHSLNEIYRVMAPGGVLLLSTTNRHHFELNGSNGEFNVPFYNWFPRLIKESYVFQHLHYDPKLANYTERPAVHWLSFADLCKYGRDAGFAQFYSIVDLMRISDPSITKSALRRFVLPLIQRSPWLRSLALTQVGHMIFMLKRS